MNPPESARGMRSRSVICPATCAAAAMLNASTLTNVVPLLRAGMSERKAIFISHATPEDNPFTLRLGAKLSVLG